MLLHEFRLKIVQFESNSQTENENNYHLIIHCTDKVQAINLFYELHLFMVDVKFTEKDS